MISVFLLVVLPFAIYVLAQASAKLGSSSKTIELFDQIDLLLPIIITLACDNRRDSKLTNSFQLYPM